MEGRYFEMTPNERLKLFIDHAGIKQIYIAEKSRYSANRISSFIKGKAIMGEKQMRIISESVEGLTYSYLNGEDENKYNEIIQDKVNDATLENRVIKLEDQMREVLKKIADQDLP